MPIGFPPRVGSSSCTRWCKTVRQPKPEALEVTTDYKPADFFVGVIDFFAVLLPGAIVVAILRPGMTQFVFGAGGFLPPLAPGAEGWMAFLVAAYLVGHILFLLGALIDSPLYDPLRRRTIPPERDQAYTHATGVKRRVLPEGAGLNTFQWARATLQLRAPSALAEIERYEADSKFFRSLVVALYVLLLVAVGQLVFGSETPVSAAPVVRGPAAVAFFAAVALPAWLAVAKAWRDHKSRKEAEAPTTREKRRSAEVPAFWPLLGLIVLVLTVSVGLLSWKGSERPVVLLVVCGLALWRYAERRWKSTRTAYQYAVILYDQALPPQAAAGDADESAPGTSTTAGTAAQRGSPGIGAASQGKSLSPVRSSAQAGAIAMKRVDGAPHVLLVRAKQDPAQWIFPKGHIEDGETAEAAALRELREEAGVTGRLVARIGVLEFTSGRELARVEYFLVEVTGVREVGPGDGRERRWCRFDEARRLLTFHDAKELLARALRLFQRTPSTCTSS